MSEGESLPGLGRLFEHRNVRQVVRKDGTGAITVRMSIDVSWRKRVDSGCG